MKFTYGHPKPLDNPEGFSVYAEVHSISQTLNIKREKVLSTLQKINVIVISLITTVLLGSVTLQSSNKFKLNILYTIISYIVSLIATYFIKIITQKVYKPQFYENTAMKLADVIDKVVGPNKNWDIINSTEYQLRKKIEFEIRSVIATFIFFFILTISISLLKEAIDGFKGNLNPFLFTNSIYLVICYFCLIFSGISAGITIKYSRISFIIFCIISFVVLTVFISLLITSYASLLLGI